LNEDADLLFSENKGRDFILGALGEDRAKQLLGQVVEVGTSNTLESLELVDTRTLANFLINEHPQTIALIVAHLETERKVDVRFREEKDFLIACNKYAYTNTKWTEVLHSQNLNTKIPIMICMDVREESERGWF
jgi:hypothetical protein